jgi:hypothetical protein
MEYEFRVNPRKGFLHVVVVGDNTAETVLRYLKQVYETCVKLQCPSVLVEENLEGAGLDLGEIFGLVAEGSRSVWPAVQRIAYVDLNRHHDPKNMKFAETVGVNRSVNVRVFGAVQAAENWLLQQLNPPPEIS